MILWAVAAGSPALQGVGCFVQSLPGFPLLHGLRCHPEHLRQVDLRKPLRLSGYSDSLSYVFHVVTIQVFLKLVIAILACV